MTSVFYIGAAICACLAILSLCGWSTQQRWNAGRPFLTKMKKAYPNRRITIISQCITYTLAAFAISAFGMYQESQHAIWLLLSICCVAAIIIAGVIVAFVIKAKKNH